MKMNRTLIGILCVAVALVLVFVLAPTLQRASGETREIIRIAKDIPRGTQLREGDIEIISVGTANLPVDDNSHTYLLDSKYKASLLSGNNGGAWYAKEDLFKGDYFTRQKITESNYLAKTSEDAFTNDLATGKVAISFKAGSYPQMLSGKLQNGDIISLIVMENGISTGVIPPELRYIQILTTTTSSGIDRDKLQPDEKGVYENAATITAIVRREQAQLLAFYNATTSMHAVLVCRGSNYERAQSYLEAEDAYMDSVYGPISGQTITEEPTDTSALVLPIVGQEEEEEEEVVVSQ